MPNSNNLKPLEAFTFGSDISILIETPFSELYPWYYFDRTNDLKKEIFDNLTTLSDKKFNAYINYVSDEINNTFIYAPDSSIIDKWLKKYNLEENDFPFYENEQINILISTPSNDKNLAADEKKLVKSIQKDFHLYAEFLEALKISALIDELSVNNYSLPTIPRIGLLSTKMPKKNIEKNNLDRENNPNNKLNDIDLIPLKDSSKKVSEKWYALLYLIELKSKEEKVTTNQDGAFVKSELEAIGKQLTGKKGQGFYRAVREYHNSIDSKEILAKAFGKDWKEQIISMVTNDLALIEFINKTY